MKGGWGSKGLRLKFIPPSSTTPSSQTEFVAPSGSQRLLRAGPKTKTSMPRRPSASASAQAEPASGSAQRLCRAQPAPAESSPAESSGLIRALLETQLPAPGPSSAPRAARPQLPAPGPGASASRAARPQLPAPGASASRAAWLPAQGSGPKPVGRVGPGATALGRVGPKPIGRVGCPVARPTSAFIASTRSASAQPVSESNAEGPKPAGRPLRPMPSSSLVAPPAARLSPSSKCPAWVYPPASAIGQ